MEKTEASREVVSEAKTTSDLLTRLQESLARAADKNDSLLEAIETTEARATREGQGGSEMSLLRNLRARLAACHAPNSNIQRDLATVSAQFQRQWQKVEETLREWEEKHRHLRKDQDQLDDRYKRYDAERKAFEEERSSWQEELGMARQEVLEQNDRLTLLSQQLAGTKEALEMKTSELASQRIAFEEEKLVQQTAGVKVQDSEAEQLRHKLKEQVLKNVELEGALLRAELGLQQRGEAGRALETRVQRLDAELQQARLASSRAVKQFERRTTEANKKLSDMTAELSKAQEHARRFQDLLTAERRKQKSLKHALEQELSKKEAGQGAGLSATAQRAYVETLSESLSPHTKSHGPVRVDDVIRKNEVVLVENRGLRAEVRRLHVENSDLLRKVRFADSNAHYMRNQVVSNIADRAELLRRLDKAETQYKELECSLTQQAAEWVRQKRREKKAEKTIRWAQVEPIPELGASERTWNVTSKAQTQGRSIPVHKW
jgi:chromosome segregation ATPase